MKSMKESTEGYKIPETYELRYAHLREGLNIMDSSRSSSDGVLDVLALAYAYGFKRGVSYQKRKAKK